MEGTRRGRGPAGTAQARISIAGNRGNDAIRGDFASCLMERFGTSAKPLMERFGDFAKPLMKRIGDVDDARRIHGGRGGGY